MPVKIESFVGGVSDERSAFLIASPPKNRNGVFRGIDQRQRQTRRRLLFRGRLQRVLRCRRRTVHGAPARVCKPSCHCSSSAPTSLKVISSRLRRLLTRSLTCRCLFTTFLGRSSAV